MRTIHTLRAGKFRYATAADFGEIFASEMNSLFLLSLLLRDVNFYGRGLLHSPCSQCCLLPE
jgi:hypothetical protein